jgi:hypothetical protein
MPAARKIYVLTQDGQVQAVTYSKQKAEQWMALGDMYDYMPLVPEDLPAEGGAVPSAKEAPGVAAEETQRITDEADTLRKQLEKQYKRFQPKSSLLQ